MYGARCKQMWYDRDVDVGAISGRVVSASSGARVARVLIAALALVVMGSIVGLNGSTGRAQVTDEDGLLSGPEQAYATAQAGLACPANESVFELTSVLGIPETEQLGDPISDFDALTRFLAREYPHLASAQFTRIAADAQSSVFTLKQTSGSSAGKIGAIAFALKHGNHWVVPGFTACNNVLLGPDDLE
jgi:hypothetical protein